MEAVSTETKAPRTISDIQAEYNSISTQVGMLTYQAEAIKGQLNGFFLKMSELNKEALERSKLDKGESNVSAV